MPGYLMNMMVLIEADNWLGQVVTTLGNRDKKSDLETKVLSLASQARQYLHFNYDPAVATEDFPLVSPAEIENNIGSGITQYAFMGAIGPDFPAAGNILALNHGWIASTMHIGAPRHSLLKAGTTEFVKNCIKDDTIKAAVTAVNDKKEPEPNVKEYKKPVMAYLLGHLSSIATHVLVEPFINQWAWREDNTDRSKFVVQLDAQIAKGYFQRDDLRSGQSWTAYLPDIGYLGHRKPKGIQLITELYQQGFQKTYGIKDEKGEYGGDPREDLSNFRKAFADKNLPPSKHPKLTKLPALENGGVYTGYANLLKSCNDADQIEEAIDAVKGLRELFYDYEAKTPDVAPDTDDGPPDPPLLIDGYRNTRNWALGWGYDRSPSLPWPPWRFSIIMSLAVLYGSVGPVLDLGVTKDVWDEVTKDVVTDSSGAVTKSSPKADSWISGGMFADHLMWHDALDKSYSVSGSLLWLFNSVLSGIQICDIWQTGRGTKPGQGKDHGEAKGTEATAAIVTGALLGGFEGTTAGLDDGVGEGVGLGLVVAGIFAAVVVLASKADARRFTDGIFGEGTDGWKEWWQIRKGKWWFKLINFLKSPGFSPPVDGWLDLADGGADKGPNALAQIWTWISVTTDITLDAVETLYFEKEDASKGREGDRLQKRLWFLQWWMTGAYFLSSLLVFGVKAADDPRSKTKLDTNLRGRDYLLSLIFPVLLIAYKVWYAGGFEGELLKSIVGIEWPSTDTDKVDSTILPIEKDSTGKNVFSAARAQALAVRVFPSNTMKEWTPPGGANNKYYPQDETKDIPWEDIPKRDDQERARKSKSTAQNYTLKDILEKATFFSGILAMAAVNYDSAGGKDCADQIFRDWNLNHRAEDEWNELMEARPDGTPGFVKAVQQWWGAVSKGLDPDPSAVVQMEVLTCLRKDPVQISGRIEDRTVAPNNDKQDTAHIYLNAPFKVVDAKGNVVKTDHTDKDGNFSFTLPGPGDYELQVDGYQGILWTNLGSC